MVDQLSSSRPACFVRAKLIPRLSFQTSVIYRRTYGTRDPTRFSWLLHENSWMCRGACQRQKSPWSHTGHEEHPMWRKVASLCETQPQQGGSVTSHQHRHKLWNRYLYKSFIDLFQKKSFHQSLRHQFLLNNLLRLTMKICNPRINHSRVCSLQ